MKLFTIRINFVCFVIIRYSLPSTGERRARDVRTVRQSPGKSHSVHLRVSQHANAANRGRQKRFLGHGPAALRHRYVPVPWTPQPGVQRPHRFSQLDENRHRLRRRGW